MVDLRMRFHRFSHKNFGDAYRSFELLQQLEYNIEAQCDNPDCPGFGVDGVVVSIQRSKSMLQRSHWEADVGDGFAWPDLPSFHDHVLIHDDALRNLLHECVFKDACIINKLASIEI
jgi:hypothetical protein